jgi:hypothetical protein
MLLEIRRQVSADLTVTTIAANPHRFSHKPGPKPIMRADERVVYLRVLVASAGGG